MGLKRHNRPLDVKTDDEGLADLCLVLHNCLGVFRPKELNSAKMGLITIMVEFLNGLEVISMGSATDSSNI